MNSLLVTVGTHEQPFDRLLRAIDDLADDEGRIRDMSVFCQFGYTTYVPNVPGQAMLDSAEFERRLSDAELVVTHGGPGSIMPGLRAGQRLILVPRQRKYGEHVDDHQVAFCRRLGEHFDIPVVEDISDLDSAFAQALSAPDKVPLGDSHNSESIRKLAKIIADLVAV